MHPCSRQLARMQRSRVSLDEWRSDFRGAKLGDHLFNNYMLKHLALGLQLRDYMPY